MNSRYSIWLLANAISLSISLASDLTMSMMRTQLISPFLHKSGPSSLLPSLWFTPASSLCSYRFQWAVQYLCGYSVDWKAIMLNHSVSGGIRWMGTVPCSFKTRNRVQKHFLWSFYFRDAIHFPTNVIANEILIYVKPTLETRLHTEKASLKHPENYEK